MDCSRLMCAMLLPNMSALADIADTNISPVWNWLGDERSKPYKS